MNGARASVAIGACALAGVWVASHFGRLTGEQHGVVRFVLGVMFALLVLFRQKPANAPAPPRRMALLAALGVGAALATVGGLIFGVHQIEWLGIILLLYACLRWSLPERFAGDIIRALFLLYWIHPLPGQLFNPLQLAMQQWSIAGAEWILHALNVRVWADGFFLYSGFAVIGVPESCSGMRTSLSVLLCGLGVGMLCRFGIIEMVILLVGGLVQVLILNVIRISWVVAYAPSMPPEWSEKFLHDTLGVFLLSAIVLVQVEAAAWQMFKMRLKRKRDGIASHELERPERASRFPQFWNTVFKWAWVLLMLSLIAMAGVLAVYKSRPAHREQMRRDVIDGLMESDKEVAERAITQVLARHPDDQEMLGKKARVQVLRKDFSGALETYALMQGELSPLDTVLKSTSLVAVGRIEEAVALVDALPEIQRQLPGVAMLRAEYAAIQSDPELCSKYIVFAGNSTIDPDRVRMLYPYLARHEQWTAIAKSDSDHPYRELSEALISAHACLRINDLNGSARTMRQALAKWGYDSRFLRSLSVLAARQPGGEWEDHFAKSFETNVETLDAEEVVPYITYCFNLSRPDLAWLAYLRLLEVDAHNPDVYYTPAQFGGRWFTARRHVPGVEGDRTATIDLRPLAVHTRHLWPAKRLWSRVPLEKELTQRTLGPTRDRYMKWTLNELDSREKSSTLSRRGEMIYPSVLASEARFDEAHDRLDLIRKKYPFPEFVSQVLLQHAEFYDQQQRWEESYEALREYFVVSDLTELQSYLIMVNALLNLNFAVQALALADEAATTFPGVGYVDLLRAAIWDIFGFKEQALFVLGDHQDDVFLHTSARLNAETGRIGAADAAYSALGIPFDENAANVRQSLLPLPAEMTIERRWPDPPSAEDVARDLERSRARQAAARGPFIRALEAKSVDWFSRPDDPAAASVDDWRKTGRDAAERATALHRLTVYQARRHQFDQATVTARAAVKEAPASPILHRVLIALTQGDREVVKAARAACPADPEIWLAGLVVEFKAIGAGPWVREAVDAALAAVTYTPDALVRAGDFFLRQGLTEDAGLLAREAMKRGRGLVSADALALRCALKQRDGDWALTAARRGVEHALEPEFFYRAIVQIKTIQATRDADLMKALEYLNEHFPKNAEWGQYLGHLYFQRGDSRRAMTLLEPLITRELAGVRVRSLLLAAEAARLSGYDGRAIGILERGLALHPDQMAILNNLIYNLSQRAETAPRARDLLPRLLALNSESYAVLDTAAMVHLRNGDVPQARAYMERAIANLGENDYGALETRLNAAEILTAAGELTEARARIEAVRRDPRAGDMNFIDSRARDLMEDIQRREAAQANP